MGKNKVHIRLHPADIEKIQKYCDETDVKKATVIAELVHLAIAGVLVRVDSKRSYFDFK